MYHMNIVEMEKIVYKYVFLKANNLPSPVPILTLFRWLYL